MAFVSIYYPATGGQSLIPDDTATIAYWVGKGWTVGTSPAITSPDMHVISQAYFEAHALTKDSLAYVIATDATYAADPTGSADATSALQAAATAAAAAGKTLYAAGTFKTSSTVTITGDADLRLATFNYTPAGAGGVAVQVGAGTSGTLLQDRTVRLPTVVNAKKTTTGWAQTGVSGSVGVQAINTDGCVIWVPHIRGFETGYYAYGLGTGNVYNEVHLMHLDNNKRNMVAGAGTGGWSNSNNYYLGLLTHNSGEGGSVTGTRCILHESATNLVDANHYFGGSVEGDVAEFHLEDNGLYNIYDGLRWETTGGARVKWGATSGRNDIRGGYTAQSIVETHVAGSALNRVSSTGMSRIIGSTAKAVQWLENTSSSTAAVDAVMDPGATLAGSDAATAYRVARSGDTTKMKRATDANDRLQLDHVNGRLYIADGTNTPVRFLGNLGTSAISVNGGNLSAGADNTLDVGQASFRFRYGRFGTAVQVGAFATASRPSAATAGQGAMILDSTLNKPVWSDGTNWRDATGTIV